MNLQDCFTETEDHYLQLCRSSQDDSGTIMLLQDRASRRTPRRRSYSQPPCLKRREVDYCALRYVAFWMRAVHFCPFNLHWSCNCSKSSLMWQQHVLCDGGTYTLSDLRRCMKGTHQGYGSIQESERWRSYSFLAEIAMCQSGSIEHLKAMGFRLHSATPDCPQGCSKVDLGKLAVPQELQPYHPRGDSVT